MRKAAFTLLEVALALGLLAFCGMALLSLLPVALRHTAENLHETRSAHLAGIVFSTLRGEPFRAAKCFGSVVDLGAPAGGPLVFHGTFGVDGKPVIAASGPADPDPGDGYRLELRLEPVATLPGAATHVLLDIRAAGETRPRRFRSIIGDP